jgi:DNA-binding XRE family transcriptional regulator
MQKSDIYDVSAELEREFGPVGSGSWKKAVQQAWDEYSAQILLDARKDAKKTQAEVAQKIGATKSYISRVEHGQIIPTVATFYRILHACDKRVEIVPL